MACTLNITVCTGPGRAAHQRAGLEDAEIHEAYDESEDEGPLEQGNGLYLPEDELDPDDMTYEVCLLPPLCRTPQQCL